jgi:hypothetical protein
MDILEHYFVQETITLSNWGQEYEQDIAVI